jgi:hypothetical protein
MIGRGNWSTRRKPVSVPLRPPQIPHDLTGRELVRRSTNTTKYESSIYPRNTGNIAHIHTMQISYTVWQIIYIYTCIGMGQGVKVTGLWGPHDTLEAALPSVIHPCHIACLFSHLRACHFI